MLGNWLKRIATPDLRILVMLHPSCSISVIRNLSLLARKTTRQVDTSSDSLLIYPDMSSRFFRSFIPPLTLTFLSISLSICLWPHRVKVFSFRES